MLSRHRIRRVMSTPLTSYLFTILGGPSGGTGTTSVISLTLGGVRVECLPRLSSLPFRGGRTGDVVERRPGVVDPYILRLLLRAVHLNSNPITN